jgi:predicted ferric reductase
MDFCRTKNVQWSVYEPGVICISIAKDISFCNWSSLHDLALLISMVSYSYTPSLLTCMTLTGQNMSPTHIRNVREIVVLARNRILNQILSVILILGGLHPVPSVSMTCFGVPSIPTIFISFSFLHHYMFLPTASVVQWSEFLAQSGDVLCFLWGTNWIYICYVEESRPPLWSSGQSSWLQIQGSRVRFPGTTKKK